MTSHTRLSSLSRSIEGRVALVTGAASGMGRATAILFSDEGASVAVVDRNADGVREVVELLQSHGRRAQGFVCDVSQAGAVEQCVADVAAALGPIDILINNAGVAMSADLSANEDDWLTAWETTFAVNLTSYARFVRAALPMLVRNRDGRVVNIASTEGLGATRGIPAYTSSKHGVIGLTRSMAMELARQGVTVNCVCPGPIKTGMTSNIPDDHKNIFAKRRTPIGRYADPEEVAQVTLSVVLPASQFLVGAVIPVDGGLTIQNT
jgi:3-oxoacyl-[acyl-carrier protein] reductase